MPSWSKDELTERLANNDQLQLDVGATAVRETPGVVIVGGGRGGGKRTALATVVPKITKTEQRFQDEILEPALVAGELVFWMREPAIRMVGQTYTPDYMSAGTAGAAGSGGVVRFYEVKGKFKLGSQDRSSAKIRWAAADFASPNIEFWWAKLDKDGRWKMKQIKPTREKP